MTPPLQEMKFPMPESPNKAEKKSSLSRVEVYDFHGVVFSVNIQFVCFTD